MDMYIIGIIKEERDTNSHPGRNHVRMDIDGLCEPRPRSAMRPQDKSRNRFSIGIQRITA